VPRLGHAIDLIRAGHERAVIPHLVHLGKEVLPFLELLERELKLGLPLADIENGCATGSRRSKTLGSA
jgi:hypothetical protein